MFRKPNISYLVLSIFFCSLAILSHPELTWFLFLTSLLIGLSHGLNKKAILFAIFTISGILFLTLIWWLVLAQRFGLSLFINALRTNSSFNPGTFLFYFTGELFASLLAVIALFGLFAEIARKKFFILLWLVVISIFSPRSALMSNIPVAILFGSGFVWVLIPGLLSYAGRPSIEYQTISELFREKISKIAFSVIMILAFFSALLLPLLGSAPVKAISQFDQQAMNWVSINTPSNSKFVVLTGGEWTTDYISEWFTALSNRISVSTVQGSEWLPDYRYNDLINLYKEVQICAMENFSCLLSWEKNNGISYSYLYISKV